MGISNTSLIEIYSLKGYAQLKPAQIENTLRIPRNAENTSHLEVPIVQGNGCANYTSPVEGNISKELKPMCFQQSIQQPSCEKVTELSSFLDDGVLEY